MSLTRGDIIDDLKNMIGPGIEVDDAGLSVWVNDAYGQMVDEILKANPDYWTTSGTIDTVASTQEYTLPSDYEKMIMVNQSISGEWKRVLPMGNADIRMIPRHSDTTSDQGFSSAEPKYYILKDTTIGLMPIPDTGVAEGLKIWYVYAPSELDSDSDTPDLPARYHHIIKYGAYANYLDQDDEHVAAERMRNRFDGLVQRMVDNIAVRQEDEPRSVEITENVDLYVDQTKYI